jgi:hypothetical protein
MRFGARTPAEAVHAVEHVLGLPVIIKRAGAKKEINSAMCYKFSNGCGVQEITEVCCQPRGLLYRST